MSKMKSTRPNDPCICGSGRKFKKCCSGKLPREHRVWVDIGPIDQTEAKSINAISLDPATGKVFLHTPLGETVESPTVLSMTSYERTKKADSKKLLSLSRGLSVNNLPGGWDLSLHGHLSTFDMVFAIDTNTKEIHGERVSASVFFRIYAKRTRLNNDLFRYDVPKSAFVHLRQTPDGLETACDAITVGEVPLPISPRRAMCFKGLAPDDAEKHAICKLLTAIFSDGRNRHDVKVAIVTDHLHAFRADDSCERALYGSFVLPESVSIIYASDAASETALNLAIKLCDKKAGAILSALESQGLVELGGQRISLEQIPGVDSAESESGLL